jgi:hypothetical protein
VNDLNRRLAAIDEYYDHQRQVPGHPDGQVALLEFVLKLLILGDDVVWVSERFLSQLERNSMFPLVALLFRLVPHGFRFLSVHYCIFTHESYQASGTHSEN